ncbi:MULTISPECIES: acyl carrier protein [Williamsia]|uniref:Acyl carrier protein n=1 Tax=Williamsia limnetica TaxID=882452 RepID=A0A318RNM1_WILLI|nr:MULTISPECIES: acyl carrier protein [Williamsia]ORM37602.1 acyl carrier protein [Williamsia sp. 1135]PYE20225.1 acyl carrier protein [Williamsia limnetica]
MEERIREVLANHGRLSVDPQSVTSEADLYELGLTSHASVNVMLALEDEFDVEFPDEDLKKATFSSVQSLATVVNKLLDGVA